jgi:gamma-aminobutyric acid receptor subunit epsilon
MTLHRGGGSPEWGLGDPPYPMPNPDPHDPPVPTPHPDPHDPPGPTPHPPDEPHGPPLVEPTPFPVPVPMPDPDPERHVRSPESLPHPHRGGTVYF